MMKIKAIIPSKSVGLETVEGDLSEDGETLTVGDKRYVGRGIQWVKKLDKVLVIHSEIDQDAAEKLRTLFNS